MENSIKINNLSVVLGGKVKALDKVSIDLPTSKTVGVIGPSGAGKTTLIKSIVGRLKISDGSIQIFGLPAGSKELRTKVTYMTQELSVYEDLTIRENLRYFSVMSDQSKSNVKRTVNRVLDLVDLVDKSNVLVRDLSGGQKQRVSLAIALIGTPKLMVLDEPTVGLDPVLRNKLWDLFSDLANQGTSLIISSHSMDEARRCDYLVLIRDGKIVANSSPKELLKKTNSDSVEQSFLKLVVEK